ncbi:hypothetical protein [Psychrobacillus sp. L3]|uniref:hypothetical protein n=1 Tax=Psychrobacillus sp. L3 TaxID=3236891 RepID=UPI0036F1FA84
MRKSMFFVLSLVFMSVILIGCQSEDNTTIDADQTNPKKQSEENEKLKIDGVIAKVNISKSKGGNPIIFDDDNAIENFKSIISSAVKLNGIVNMTNPEFYMDIAYENEEKQSFQLWLGGTFEESTLMKTDDTHTIYILPEESTNKIIDLME